MKVYHQDCQYVKSILHSGWSHQYVTQTNQPWSRNLTEDPWFNVATYSNTFGLEPNFVSEFPDSPLSKGFPSCCADADEAMLYRESPSGLPQVRLVSFRKKRQPRASSYAPWSHVCRNISRWKISERYDPTTSPLHMILRTPQQVL